MKVFILLFCGFFLMLYSGSEEKLKDSKVVSLQQQIENFYYEGMESGFKLGRESLGNQYTRLVKKLSDDITRLPYHTGCSFALYFFFNSQFLKLNDIKIISDRLSRIAHEAEDLRMEAASKYLSLYATNASTLPLREDRVLIFDIVQRGDFLAAEIFFQQGIKVNIFRGLNSLLTVAVETGNSDMVALLLDYGGDPNIQNGFKPLYKAALNGNEQIIKMLLDSGARLDASYMGNGRISILEQIGIKARQSLEKNDAVLIEKYNNVLGLLQTYTII